MMKVASHARSVSWALAASLCLVGGCGADEDDDKKDNEPDPSAWLVGDKGEMLRLGIDGESEHYPLDRDEDFTAIACRGAASAWVVGARGTILMTRDGGHTWDLVGAPASTDLTDVAVAEQESADRHTVVVAGLSGTLLRTEDAGETWIPYPSPTVAWSGIAVDETAEILFATTTEGAIWRATAIDTLEQVHESAWPLHGISTDATGQRVIAVGDRGVMLSSEDAGNTWSSVDPPTERDLRAVHVGHDGQTVVAVGDAGVIVRIHADDVRAREHLEPGQSLHALHLRADGLGHAVGDDGTVLQTEDAGVHWALIPVESDQPLRGIDDFHAGRHL